MEELEDLEDISGLEEYKEGIDSEVLCFILKDENQHCVIGGRYNSYIEAKAMMGRFSDRTGLVIYKVIKDNGKRIFKAM